uniref:Uncharacterized protein n=1 Tax=Triticum urartu TaxID=4572 RepID=A0A8R7K0H9_TRIUA
MVADVARVEGLPRRVGEHQLVLGPVEDGVAGRQHGRDGHHLLGAPVLLRRHDGLGEHGVQGELRHPPPGLGELAAAVERAEGEELLQGLEQRLRRRRVHEVEAHQVVDAQRLEPQHHVGQVAPLDLRDRVVVQVMPEVVLREEAEALARARAPRPAGALVRRRLGDGLHAQRLHARARVVRLELAEARVDHVLDPVDGQRRLGDVGRQNHLAGALRRRLEDLGLELGGQVRVDRADHQLRNLAADRPHLLLQQLFHRLDLLLPREEQQDVAGGLLDVQLQDRDDGGGDVVRLRRRGVVDVHLVPPPGDLEDGGLVEEVAEPLGVERRAGDEQLHVRPEARDVLYQAEEDVGGERALVRLVHDHHAVARQVRLAEELAQEHPVRHVLDHRLVRGAVLEPDGVADLVPELDAQLLRHPRRHAHGRHAPRLRARDLLPLGRVPSLVEVLRYLRGLAGAGLSDDDQHLVLLDGLEQIVLELVHG